MRFILIGGLGLAVAAPGVAQGPAPSGAVRGVVYDSLITSRPLEGAERAVQANTGASGHVRLCGRSTDVALVIRGRTDGGSAGMLVVDLAGRAFARADLSLATAPLTGEVKGVVRNRNGGLVPRATV